MSNYTCNTCDPDYPGRCYNNGDVTSGQWVECPDCKGNTEAYVAKMLVQGLREVLEQGNWRESGAGYEMTGGMWIDSETFAELFPGWPADLPHVEPELQPEQGEENV